MKRILQLLICFSTGGLFVITIARGQSIYSTPYTFTTIAGATNGDFDVSDGTNNAARFYWPEGITADSAGNIYVADTSNQTIRKLTPVGTNWVVSTIAGTARSPGHADGTNLDAQFYYPSAIIMGTNGDLYVADTYNQTIRKLTPLGTNWVVSTIAGMVETPGPDDGTNFTAQFNYPSGITADTNGNLYVADTYNYTIRKLDQVGTNWVVSTIAGTAQSSGPADGTNFAAQFNYPYGITADTSGNLYVADTYNDTIRKLTPIGTNWVVSTIAGTAQSTGFNDGTNLAAQFNYPYGITADTSGNLYVADTDNYTIRQLTPVGTNWVTSTLAGLAGSSGTGTDGTGANALFNYPYGITVDHAGNLYVADTDNSAIRMGRFVSVMTPNLAIKFEAPNNVVISWPELGSFTLQTNSDLKTTNWGNYNGTITSSGGTNSVTITPPSGNLFFRLIN